MFELTWFSSGETAVLLVIYSKCGIEGNTTFWPVKTFLK